jgi:TetR/AcrR family transcriptional regulator
MSRTTPLTTSSNTSTRDLILQAAKEVFTAKGYAAARTQEIADQAGVNKGLLQYYFKGNSKEVLFKTIFEEAFGKLFSRINAIFESEEDLNQKLEMVVDSYFEFLLNNPYLPTFVLNELNTRSHGFVEELLNSVNRPNPMQLVVQMHNEMAAGKIRTINPLHLVLNVVSMCIFPFIARPMFQGMIGINDEVFMQMMHARKDEVIDFIRHAIKP